MTRPDLVKLAAEHGDVNVCRLRGQQQKRDVVVLRWAVMWVLYNEAGATHAEIGRLLGDRDRKTIWHGINKASELIHDDSFCELIKKLTAALDE